MRAGQDVLGAHRVLQGGGIHSVQDGLRLVWGHTQFFQILAQGLNAGEFRLHRGHALVAGEAKFMRQRSQAFVRIVLSQKDAVFGPRGEHAVGFFGAFRHQIVDQHPDVRLASVEGDGLFVPRGTSGVDAGHQPLARGFFVARGAVDLASEVESVHEPGLQAMLELGGGEVVVFDGVSGAEHLGVLKPGNLSHGAKLHVLRKARAETVDVNLTGVPTLRFDKNLVAVFVGKPVDLVFDARAVARTQTANAPIEHGGAVKPFPKQIMHLRGRVGDVTRNLLGDGVVGEVAEASRVFVAWLFDHFGVIQRTSIHTGWGACLHAPAFKAELHKLFRDAHGGTLACASTTELFFANVHQAIEEGAVCEDHRLGANLHAQTRLDPDATPLLDKDAHHTVLPEIEVGGSFEHLSPCLCEQVAVILRSRAPHGRSFGLV